MDKRGLNSSQLAKITGLTHSAIVKYRHGRIPKSIELYRLSQALDVSMEWLISNEAPSSLSDAQAATLFAHSKEAVTSANESFRAIVSHIRNEIPALYDALTTAHGGADFLSPGSGGSRRDRAKAVKKICIRNWRPEASDQENIQTIHEILHALSFYAPLSSDTYHPIRRQAIEAGLIDQSNE